MTPEYQFYHGAVLHEIIITARKAVRIRLDDAFGRPDAYVIDDEVGVLIKHSSARLTPWLFTFSRENLSELQQLRSKTKVCFVVFVCNEDGFVSVRDTDLAKILTPTESELVSVRVDRPPRRMYRVSSSGNELDGKLAGGADKIVEEIRQRSTECAPPSSSL